MRNEIEESDMPVPMAIGTPYDGSTITEVIAVDEYDDYQTYQYALADGGTVWIPV